MDTPSPEAKPSRFKAVWLWFWDRRGTGSRGLKYLVLLLALALNSKIVFDGFSYYLARRSLDAELEKKGVASLEHIGLLTKRERALVIDTLETRCTERNQLAIFRILDAEMQKKLRDAHAKSREPRNRIAILIDELQREHPDWNTVVDLPALRKEVGKAGFALALLPSLIKPTTQAPANDPRYEEISRAIVDRLGNATVEDVAALSAYVSTLREAQAKLGEDSAYFKNIDILERRLDRLKETRKQTKKQFDELGDILSRYAVWTEALTGGRGDNPLLDEMAFQLSDDEQRGIWQLDCERFEKYFLKVNGVALEVPRATNPVASVITKPGEATAPRPAVVAAQPPGFFSQAWDGFWESYKTSLLGFFNTPPVGQTLFVTLCLGALGALTINALRLSKIGWWQPQPDPLWGELLLSPLLGALAAFGIFLLGSTGLLLSGDAKTSASGATALSPFFIGMLGFVSGLLYDEAFGRVRRFGSQVFAGDGPVVVNTPEDQSLAEALRTNNASAAADLVLRFGIGKRTAAEPQFTLLIPSDEAMGRMSYAAWKDISEARTRPKFENWLRRRHALTRITKGDAAKTPGEILVEDGIKFPVIVEDDALKVGGIKVVKADISWNNGVIHILDGDLPNP